jgi:hypothetical protein
MITVIPALPPELDGVTRPFGFKTKYEFKESNQLQHRSPFEKISQERLIGQLCDSFKELQSVACEIQVTVGVQYGQQTFEGGDQAL